MGEPNPRSSHTSPETPLQTGHRADPLDRLRSMRVRPERARDLGSDMQMQMKALRKVSRAEASLQRAWEAAAPDELVKHCTLAGIRAGKVIVHVPDAPTRYRAQQWLRSGGLGELSALAKLPIRGVQFQLVAAR
ncbi:MAG: DciA family protein [Phycisphaerales bacterium]